MAKSELIPNSPETVVITPAQENMFYYAQRSTPAFQKAGYDVTRRHAETNFPKAQAFKQYFKYNEKTGEINGSNLFWDAAFDISYLREKGLWLPTFQEARILEVKKKLSIGVYRGFGPILYNEQKPNAEFAKPLVEQAQAYKLSLPLVIPFKAIELQAEGSEFGVTFSLLSSLEGVVSGNEARKLINQCSSRADSGFRRSDRSGGGGWGARWDVVAGSSEYGRVGDWVCGLAARENLEKVMQQEIKMCHDKTLAQHKNEIRIKQQELRALNKKETQLNKEYGQAIRGISKIFR